ncbi:MAG: heavy metal-binding domain-containing protein [Candidatus Izemoplasma sp.]|nr:heavy metal-binding domain-containing protein [Candidatus Izemoplasma sp.]
MMTEARQIATERLLQEADEMGADAVLCFRLQTSQVMGGAAEIIAYGTAVTFKKIMRTQHIMEQKPKLLTIIGLVFEGVAVISMVFFTWILLTFTESKLYALIEVDTTPSELEEIEMVLSFIQTPILVLAIIMAILLVVNLFCLRYYYEESSHMKQPKKSIYIKQLLEELICFLIKLPASYI